MKRLILLLLCCIVVQACRDEQDRQALNSVYDDAFDSIDTTSYPLFIEGGSKIVYPVGYMTPDKGLKIYLDTIPNPAGGLRLDGAVRSQLEVE